MRLRIDRGAFLRDILFVSDCIVQLQMTLHSELPTRKVLQKFLFRVVNSNSSNIKFHFVLPTLEC